MKIYRKKKNCSVRSSSIEIGSIALHRFNGYGFSAHWFFFSSLVLLYHSWKKEVKSKIYKIWKKKIHKHATNNQLIYNFKWIIV